MLMDSPLCSLRRGECKEISIRGEIVVSDGTHPLFQTAEALGQYPARSLLKPFQFLAAKLPEKQWASTGGVSRFTACVGSISATEDQTQSLKLWYSGSERFERRIKSIHFPLQYPMDEGHRSVLKSQERPAEVFHHNCFSKHMAILESCDMNGWPFDGYHTTAHPYHEQLCETLSRLLPKKNRQWEFVEDGCTLPSPLMTLSEMASLYQKLSSAEAQSRLGKIRGLMLDTPQWIGGPGRVDTKLMELNPGKVIAKEGADGLLALGVLPNATYPTGLGIVIKLAAGYLPHLAALSLQPLLEFLALKGPGMVPRGQNVEFHYVPFQPTPIHFWEIGPVVKASTLVWPQDTPFHRTVSMDTQNGSHLTLSKIETTLHLGAHADAPNHFSKGGGGIESVAPSKYLGLCQLMEVPKKNGGAIGVADLEGQDLFAKRVLIRTGSFPQKESFNENFAFLSSEAVAFLREQGVWLVGIDTPSIDAFSSKTMEAHKETLKNSMGILEGLVLDGISPGLYELIALPLRFQDADASPVRALLRKI